MDTFPFDTLKMARKLEASGMDRAMARGVVEVVVDALMGTKMATKSDTARTKTVTAGSASGLAGYSSEQRTPYAWPGDITARIRRDFTIQLGGMFVMWVCITILGFSCLLPYR